MRLAGVFFAALLLGACASDAPTETQSPLEGTITDVTVDNGSVTEFEMLTSDGEDAVVTVDGERDYGFDLLHLEEHAETGDPVFVETHREGNRQIAFSIEDG